ncbi:MAG TPA: ornithine carbamoyltransferase [Methyloceanibacter sp.]|nr:ornithine carbamoyltransferase [Methyloceanibacter sp.]
MKPRHFLDIEDFPRQTLRAILDDAHAMKALGRNSLPAAVKVRPGAVLAMIFEQPSTRTRVSFEVAMHELGGTSIMLSPADMQIGRGETIADTARVLSRYVDAIMIRTSSHGKLLELAAHATVPVINGLTNLTHPCQVMADVKTFEEKRGSIEGKTVAWLGDANNVAASWVHGAARFGYALKLACPKQFKPAPELLAWAKAEGASVEVLHDPLAAARGADCVVTDVWVSMGDGEEKKKRKDLLKPFQVDRAVMKAAKPDAIFMHCLPAHRGDEVTPEVIDGPQSVVWDEAENRLHVQKAILAWCLDTARAGAGEPGAKNLRVERAGAK